MGFVDVGFFNVVTAFLHQLVFGPEVASGAEGVTFFETAAEGIVFVFGGLAIFFDAHQLVLQVVFKVGDELATFTAGFFYQVAAFVVFKLFIAL